MGAGNSSYAQLSSYQEAVSEVIQDVSNSATNNLQTNVSITQNIEFVNGATPPNPCVEKDNLINLGNQTYINWLDSHSNATEEEKDMAPGIHPCINKCKLGSKYTSRVGGKTRNAANCNDFYSMTLAEAKSILPTDIKCNVQNDSCRTAFLRNRCENIENYDTLESCNDRINKVYYEINNNNNYKYTSDQTAIAGIPNCFASNPGQVCYNNISLNEFGDYYCGLVDNTGADGYAVCKNACESAKCTDNEREAYKPNEPTIDGTINITNKSSTSVMNDQTATAETNATLNASVLNQFQNDIVKDITQENKFINFGQFNNSVEMTNLIQKASTLISQSLSANSKNLSVTNTATTQNIKFTNLGKINTKNCSDSGGVIQPDGSVCAINLTNDNITTINNSQTSKSVVTAMLSANIVNDLMNKYKLTVKQTNSGLDLVALFAMIIILFIILSVGIVFIAKALGKVVEAGAETAANAGSTILGFMRKHWIISSIIIFLLIFVTVILPMIIVFATSATEPSKIVEESVTSGDTSKCDPPSSTTNFLTLNFSMSKKEDCSFFATMADEVAKMNLGSINMEKIEIQKRLDEKYPKTFQQIFTYVNGEIVQMRKMVNGAMFRFVIMKK